MVELLRTLSLDQHILPQLLKQREKYSGCLCEEGYDTAALKKELDVRIVGQERDNSILVAWNDASPSGTAGHRVTYFGLFEYTQHQLRLLFIHDKKVVVTGASVNQERHLLAFTITEPYVASVDDPRSLNIPGIYKSFLAEIRPQNRIFSLYIERHTFQRIQFLYGEYHGYRNTSKRESHMLFLHHQEAIGLYHIPMARFADKGMIISDQPRTEQVADKFVWAQWDSHQQQLFLVYPKYKDADAEANERESEAVLMFAAYQFNEKSSHVRVLNFPLPFPDVNLSVKTSYPQYLDMALTQTVSERNVNIQVVTLTGRGSFYICLQHPISGKTEESSHQKAEKLYGEFLKISTKFNEGCSSAVSYQLEYSVYAFHHGCIMNCVLPTVHHFKHVEKSRLFFSSLNDYLMVFLPGRVLHLLDCSAEHEPCHHIILQGDAIPNLPSMDASCKEPPLLLYLNKEVATSLQTGPYIFDSSSGDAYKYNFDKTALAELFARTHMPSTRLAILHLAVIHLRDSSLIRKIFEHLSRDPASPECLHLLREYLAGSTYGRFRRQLEKEAVKLIPFTCVDTFRGHLEKDINRKRIAQISCSFVRDNPIEFQSVKGDKKKQADFWTALLQNTKRPPPRLQLRASQVVENNDRLGDSGDEVESAPPPGLVASLYRKLHVSARKLSGSNESIASQESNKNISKDFLDSTEEERSVAEIKKQNTTIDRLATHLQTHLPRETRVKVQNIAIEYVKFQAYQSDTLLRLLFEALSFTGNPFSEPLSLPCTTRDAVFFQLIERYCTAVTELSFPFPIGFRTSMTILGFRCLNRRMFLQYVDHGVLLLKSGFITRLLEDFTGEGENEDYVFQIICRLKHASAKNALRHWEHPVAARYVSQQLVDDLLTGGVGGVRESSEQSYPAWRENSENSTASSRTSLDDSQTFRPLATLMATLTSDAQQLPRCVNETDFNFIEERALLETQRETVGSLGTIPF